MLRTKVLIWGKRPHFWGNNLSIFHGRLGVPTFKKRINLIGLHEDFKNVDAHFCPASLPNFLEQACWAEFVSRGGLSDQKFKKGTFVRVEKLSLWESPVTIHDVEGTPNAWWYLNRRSGRMIKILKCCVKEFIKWCDATLSMAISLSFMVLTLQFVMRNFVTSQFVFSW